MTKKETKEQSPIIDSNWSKFQKGRAKTGGRAKGVPNKLTARVAEALQAVYEEIGGDEALAAFAKDDPANFFKLYAKMLPQHIKADFGEDTLKMMAAINEGRARIAAGKKPSPKKVGGKK